MQANGATTSERAQEILPTLEHNGTKLADDVDADKLLVEIVQGLLMAHARLDQMEVTLRKAVETASLQQVTSFDQKFHDLTPRVKSMSDWQSRFSTRFDTDAKAQGENWKKLGELLQNWQSRSERFNSEVQKHVSQERTRTSGEIIDMTRLINNVQASVQEEFRRNRLRLNWVLGLMCPLIGLLGAIAYKLWIQ
jgi:hypothetical protein